jgi:hypothetical protein
MSFPLLEVRRGWAERRAFLVGPDGLAASLPAAWTDQAPLDPFREVAAGRAAVRVEDLVELARVTDALRG